MNKWLVMFAGIGTVFVALMAIIVIIQVFHLIFGIRPASKKQKPIQEPKPQTSASTAGTVPAAQPLASAEQPSSASAKSGNELVAVIAAAICAASGASPSSFRIASIQAAGSSEDGSGFNTPVWGRIERFYR